MTTAATLNHSESEVSANTVKQTSRTALLWMVPLLLAVIWLGARSIDADPMWADERRTMVTSGAGMYGPMSPLEVYQFISVDNPWHAPGFFMSYNLWGRLLGWTAPAGRFLTLLYGILALAMVYRLGAALLRDWRVGVGAAFALGFSSFYIYYLHELRPYTLVALVMTFALWLYWQMHRTAYPRWYGAVFILSFAALFYTHYFAALGGIVIGLYHLIFPKKDRHWWGLLGLMALAAVLCLPWLRVTLTAADMATTDELRAGMSLTQAEVLPQLLFSFSNGNTALWLIVAAATFPLLRQERGVRYIWFFVVGLAGIILIVNGQLQVLAALRYLMPLFPGLAIIFAIGLWYIARQVRAQSALIVMWAAWIGVGLWATFNASPLMVQYASPYSNNTYDFAKAEPTMFHPLPWLELRDTLRTHAAPGDVVSMHRDTHTWVIDGMLEYYTNGLPVEWHLTYQLAGLVENGAYDQSAEDFLADVNRIWFGYDLAERANDRLFIFQNILERDFLDCGTFVTHPNMDINLFARQLGNPANDTRHLGSFSEGIEVYRLGSTPRTDEALPVALGWSVPSTFEAASHSFGVHLLRADGTLATQYDAGLPTPGENCTAFSIPLSDTPPGTYDAQVVVYNWQTGERVAPEEDISLGQITVE